MEFSIINLFLAFGAGLASILSPCVLPVVPIIVTGTGKDHALRPVLVVTGLAVSFVGMGIISSLFGSVIAGKMLYLEKIVGSIIILFGILMLFDINLFKHLTFIYKLQSGSQGRVGGFILGLTLGIVWIPCVGPMLSSVLALVATQGHVGTGIFLLLIYSLGFAVPMLLVGYFSHIFRKRVRALQQFPLALRLFSGGVLILFGMYILFKGLMGFGWL